MISSGKLAEDDGGGGATGTFNVSVKVAFCCALPLEPFTVTTAVLAAADEVIAMAIVCVPEPLMVNVDGVVVTPEGRPLNPKVTTALNPFVPCVVTVRFWLVPGVSVIAVGDKATL